MRRADRELAIIGSFTRDYDEMRNLSIELHPDKWKGAPAKIKKLIEDKCAEANALKDKIEKGEEI